MTERKFTELSHNCYRLFVSVLTTFLFLFFSSLAVAQQGLTPEDVTKIKTVTGASISDDGNYAAYTVSVPADPKEENRPNRTELHVLNIETGETRPYYSKSSIGGVTFRPGHESITFLTTREYASRKYR